NLASAGRRSCLYLRLPTALQALLGSWLLYSTFNHCDGSAPHRRCDVSMILLNGNTLTLDEILAIADDQTPVGLAPEAATRVDASREIVDRQALDDGPVEGIQ